MTGQDVCWEEGFFCDYSPQWTREPSIDAIHQVAAAQLETDVEVSFFAEGALNKLYLIRPVNTNSSMEYLMRIALPVDPKLKVESEVATLACVRQILPGLVPEVVAFSSNARNPIGYEWILMNRINAVSLDEAWFGMTFPAKEKLVKEIVSIVAKLFAVRFPIGSLCLKDKNAQGSSQIGYSTAMGFWWYENRSLDESRGPFASAHEWLVARMSRFRKTWKSMVVSEDDRQAYLSKEILAILNRLETLLPFIFPPDQQEPTVLHHHDLNASNILVDPTTHALKAIVDWECVEMLPTWSAASLPKFLQSVERTSQPMAEKYKPDDVIDPDGLFRQHTKEYELTLLRSIFLQEIKAHNLEWFRIYSESYNRRQFECAVEVDLLNRQEVTEWLGVMESEMERGFALEKS